jgi:CubicO group peptidase (beta-lactamase class C family)
VVAEERPLRGGQVDGAGEAGLDPDALRDALALALGWVDDGVVPAVGVVVARGGRVAGELYAGRARPDDDRPVGPATAWSLASISKPMTATAAMLLVEEGHFGLDDPIHTLLPEFLDAPETPFDRRAVTPRHLLGHCSGLPGFPENNLDLRRGHRPIEEFVRAMVRQPLLFAPGTLHVYSNCAITVAAELIGRALGGALGRRVDEPMIGRFYPFVRERLFGRLGMASTDFRPPTAWHDRIAHVADTGQEGESWETCNSAYYRALGIPWGGVFGAVREVARFADVFLPGAEGVWRLDAPPGGRTRLLGAAAARAMRSRQWLLPDAPPDLAPELREVVPDPPRPEVTWGIGWMLQGSTPGRRGRPATSPATFLHGGASGTLVWADPETEIVCAVFANRASRSGWAGGDPPRLGQFVDAVARARR